MIVLANVGLPMLMLGLPLLALALIPVAGLEAAWYRYALRLTWQQAGRGSWRANLWSTFIGLPLAWACLAGVEIVIMVILQVAGEPSPISLSDSLLASYLYLVLSSPWLVPLPGDMGVIMAGAGLVLLVPAYVVSYIGEARVLRREWPEADGASVYRHSWLANSMTYAVLFAAASYRLHSLATA